MTRPGATRNPEPVPVIPHPTATILTVLRDAAPTTDFSTVEDGRAIEDSLHARVQTKVMTNASASARPMAVLTTGVTPSAQGAVPGALPGLGAAAGPGAAPSAGPPIHSVRGAGRGTWSAAGRALPRTRGVPR